MSSKLILAAAAAALSLGAPPAAHAQYSTQAYDGYCYARKSDAQKNGAIIGAIVGGLAGSQISKNERGLGAVGGAVAGGVVGSQIGKSSVKCYNGAYYAYNGRYYTPPAAPDGYDVLYFKQRPTTGDYYDRVYTSPPSGYSDSNSGGYYDNNQNRYDNGGQYNDNRYNDNRYGDNGYNNDNRYNNGYGQRTEGFRDDQGRWYVGQPRAYGWQDDRGQWHTGDVTYGYRDSRGAWHVDDNQNNR
ncbi:MAG: glycine zipper 2TM domain-containing protein [Asticcacaulis sp.]|uniref:glycine zipper 2TM domain-containing protein n=1 Tax=Asticcacaulis sp. TaxID=1872648 RepID=UPI003F7BDD1F